MQIEHLKALLVSESEGGDRSENERQLVALLKSAQEEREELLLKQIEYSNGLHHMENETRFVLVLCTHIHTINGTAAVIFCQKILLFVYS